MKNLLLSMRFLTLCLIALPQWLMAAPAPYFFEGKSLAHPVISGARNHNGMLAFLREADGVNAYYCFCDDSDRPDATPRKLDSFGNVSIASVFYTDLDNEGQIMLVLTKRDATYRLRAYRYQEHGRYFDKLPQLQKALDRIASTHKKLNALTVKRALAALTPLDYGMHYNGTGVAEFDAIDHSAGTLIAYYDAHAHATGKSADKSSVAYKKTFGKKNDLFLTVTYYRSPFNDEGAIPTYRVERITWEADPARFTGTEHGTYVGFDITCCDSAVTAHGQYDRGIKAGHWHYSTLRHESSGTYVNGRRNGRWTITNQQESATGMMTDDLREGIWVISAGLTEEDDSIRGKDTFLHDQQHGMSERYSDGKLQHQGHYEHGKRHGNWIEADSQGAYVHGVKQGPWQFNIRDGSVQKVTLVDGKNDGELRITDAKGRLRSTTHYRLGVLSGAKKVYNDTGRLIAHTDYVNGQETREIQYYDDGTLRADRSKKDGMLHGLYLYNFPNGKTQFSGHYERGMEIGHHQTFYENGKLSREDNYCRFTDQGATSRISYCGRVQRFDEQGNLVSDYDYLFGRKQIDNTYYPGGAKKEETIIEANDRLVLNHYYQDGQLRCTYPRQGYTTFTVDGNDYKDIRGAKPEGTAICYFPTGEVQTRATYINGVMQGCRMKFDISGKQIFPGPEGCPPPKKAFFVFE